MTHNKTTPQGTRQALVLTGLLVLSVVTLSVGFTGTIAAQTDGEIGVDRTYMTPDELAANDVWIGQEIEVAGVADDSVGAEIREGFPSDDANSIETAAVSDNTVRFETDALEHDEPYHLYVHIDGADDEQYTFWAYEMNFEAEFGSPTVADDEPAELEFDSDRTEAYDVNVSADGLDADTLETVFSAHETAERHDDGVLTLVNVGNVDDLEADFADVALGEYEFTFDVTDTVDETTTTIEVTEDNEDYAFVDVEQPAQGDIANITLEVTDSDSAAVVLGDRTDNFRSAIELAEIEDERIVLQFNTHIAASEDAWSVHEDSNASIADDGVDVTTKLGEGDAFPAHGWDLSVGSVDDKSAGVELENEYDRDVLSVQERSDIGAATLQTAPEAADVTDAESFEEATITPTETVADADKLILTVEDFGAAGAFAEFDDGSTLADEGLVVEIQETNPGPISDAHIWESGAGPNDVVDQLEVEPIVTGDEYDGDLHVAITYASDAYDRNLEVGEAYDVTFTVTEDNAYVDDSDDELERTLEFELVERNLEWNSIRGLPVDANATATGTTTVAPGTELSATADSPPEEGGFIQRTDTVVTAGEEGNHEFAATFDFSMADPGVIFDLIAEDPYAPDENTDVQESVELLSATLPSSAFDIHATAPTVVATGDDATLEVAVENTGDEPATSNYSVVVDGEEIDAGELELEGGESTDRSYELDTSTTGDIEWEVLTDDDDDFGTVTVESADAADENGDAATEDDADVSDDTSDDGTPGFGIALALGALLAVATLSLRTRTE